eukprot:IDg21210t1
MRRHFFVICVAAHKPIGQFLLCFTMWSSVLFSCASVRDLPRFATPVAPSEIPQGIYAAQPVYALCNRYAEHCE